MPTRPIKAIARKWWLALVLLAGVGILQWIVRAVWTNLELDRHGVTVTGRIVRVSKSTPTVEYEDASGTTHRFVPGVVHGTPRVGPIEVRYDNEHTDRAQVVAWATSWDSLFFPLPFALLMIGVPLYVWRSVWARAAEDG